MSRVGRKVIPIPKGVQVQVKADRLEVQGPKGKLTTPVPEGITFKLENGELQASRKNDEQAQRALHGLARALANNAIRGVTEGFSKELDIVGRRLPRQRRRPEGRVRARLFASRRVPDPAGIKIAIDAKANRVTVTGIDRQQVGQVAAEIRGLRKPDPYKQKGIRYVGEVLKKKAGKAGATGAK
jgi:large subunit ribosomal protein L6